MGRNEGGEVLSVGGATVWRHFWLSQRGWGVLRTGSGQRPGMLLNVLQPPNQELSVQYVNSAEAEKGQARHQAVDFVPEGKVTCRQSNGSKIIPLRFSQLRAIILLCNLIAPVTSCLLIPSY